MIPLPRRLSASVFRAISTGLPGRSPSFAGFPWQCGVLLLALSQGLIPAADLLTWDIDGTTGPTGSGIAANPSAGVSGSGFTVGGSNGNATSPSGTWNRTFSPQTEDFTAAQTAGHYFSFTTSAALGYTVGISGLTGLKLSRTTVGPTTAGLFYSRDGGVTYTQTGANFAVTTNSLTPAADAFEDTMSTTPIIMAGGDTLHWRIVVFGGTGNRLGIGKVDAIDFTLTGTSTPDIATHNLLWTGTGGSTWNTVPENRNWANTDPGNGPAAFVTNDNVAVNSPALISVDPNGVRAGTVNVSNATGQVVFTGGSITALSLSKLGEGSVSLNGVNSFSGGVAVNGGTLKLESGSAVGNSPVNINGGTLRPTPDVVDIVNPVNLGAAGATLETDHDVTFSGILNTTAPAVNESHRLVKSGPGVLTLSSTNSSTALGSQMTFNSTGGAVELDITAGGVTFIGSGQRNFGGDSTWDGPVTLNGGILMLHGGTVDGTGRISVISAASIRSRLNFNTAVLTKSIEVIEGVRLSLDSANGNNALAVRGVISGTGGITKTGNGTVRLEAANTYSDTTIIEAGTLRVGTGGNGTLGSGNVVINAGALILNRDDSTIVPNEISGQGNVTVSAGGGNTATLTGTNLYLGTTTVTGGTLRIDGDQSAATGLITISGGALLGGNGISGGSVLLQPNAGISARITHWTGGVAGTDYADLQVASLDAANVPANLVVDAANVENFSETARSFTILKALGGINNFSPANVAVTTPGFAGSGTWSLAAPGNTLVLSYAPAAGISYEAWAAGAPHNLSGNDAAAGADPDKDGVPNAIEFVVGGNPGVPSDSGKLPTATVSGTNLVFTFRRSDRSAYLNPVVQYGSYLTGWTVAERNLAGVSILESNDVESGIDLVIVTIPRSLAAGSEFFVRLRVLVP